METNNKSGGSLDGFKFNTVGREEAAVEVLRPQVDAATRTRTILFALVAAFALAGILYFSFLKTGGDLFKAPKDSRPMQAPEHDVNGL